MTHLTPNELIEALERRAASGRESGGGGGHLAECQQCQRELADLEAILSDAKQAGVPEPSPLFWSHFSGRVRTAIDSEVLPAHAWRSWLRWQVLVPFAAMAMIVLGLLISAPRQDGEKRASAPTALEQPAVLDASTTIDSWVILADLVGDMDLDAVAADGVVTPGAAEQAAWHLTADEQQELTRLLKAELTRAKS